MLDGWTDVFQVPGKRTTGTGAQTFAITGPGWSGELPKGVTEYKSPTGMVWLLGRIYSTGTPQDYKAVHALQDKITRRAAVELGQALHARAGQGRPGHRHEDRRARAGQRARCRRLLQAAGRADEDQPAERRRRADGGQAGQDRHRARAGLRPVQARARGGQGHGEGAEAGAGTDHGLAEGRHRRRRLQARERLGLLDQGRHLRHAATCSARWSPPSAWAPTGRRTRSTRPPPGRTW